MTSGNDFYKRPSDDKMLEVLWYFEEEIEYFIHNVLNYTNKVSYTVCALDILDVIIRTDKRLYYFNIFHGMEANECKKAALFAYWIAKLRPIKIIDDNHKNRLGFNDRVNELFAVHILLSTLVGIGRVKYWDGTDGIDITLDNQYITKFCYSLRFRNLTIDSMVVLADSITTDSFREDATQETTQEAFG